MLAPHTTPRSCGRTPASSAPAAGGSGHLPAGSYTSFHSTWSACLSTGSPRMPPYRAEPGSLTTSMSERTNASGGGADGTPCDRSSIGPAGDEAAR